MTRHSKDDDEALARALRAGPRDAAALDDAEHRIREGRGEALFDALVAERLHERGDVAPLMSSIERMMDGRPFVGAYLMARLSLVAARQRDHAVHDAIELWMRALRHDAVEALVQLERETKSPRLRARCAAWRAAHGRG